MSKVTANKNKNSQQMLIIMVFNTVCHHFFVNGSNVWVVILRNEAI